MRTPWSQTPGRRGEHQPATATPGSTSPSTAGRARFDGDVDTAWQVGAHAKVIGEKIRLDLDQPITTGQVNLVQPLVGPNAALPHQGRPELRRRCPGHRRPRRRVAHRRRADGDVPVAHVPPARRHDRRHQRRRRAPRSRTRNSVGFAEIRLRDDAPGAQDVRADEIVRMPTDLVDAVGARPPTARSCTR